MSFKLNCTNHGEGYACMNASGFTVSVFTVWRACVPAHTVLAGSSVHTDTIVPSLWGLLCRLMPRLQNDFHEMIVSSICGLDFVWIRAGLGLRTENTYKMNTVYS